MFCSYVLEMWFWSSSKLWNPNHDWAEVKYFGISDIKSTYNVILLKLKQYEMKILRIYATITIVSLLQPLQGVCYLAA